MIEWNMIVLLLSIVLLLFLLWKEVKRKQKNRISYRVTATIIAVIALACLGIELHYNRRITINSQGDAILLTKGFNKDSVQNLLNKYPSTPVYTLDETIKTPASFKATYVTNILAAKKPIRHIHLFGYGLSNHEIETLKNVAVTFYPAHLPTGISGINWQQKLNVGERLIVQGTINHSEKKALKLVLSAFKIPLDSITINPNENFKFQLSAIPKHLGRAVYFLNVLNGKDTVEQSPIPIEIEESKKPAVLLLASSPGFENKFLQNWLGDNGFEVSSKSMISKNKYAKNFQNKKRTSTIDDAILNNKNIVIIDALQLNNLNGKDLSIIQNRVRNNQLGLIITSGNIPERSFYSAQFSFSKMQGNAVQQIQLQARDTSFFNSSITIDQPVFINTTTNVQPIIKDKQDRIYAAAGLYGAGKIILSTITNTYHWKLAGNNQDYSNFWTALINHVVPNNELEETWKVLPQLPTVNEAATIIINAQNKLPKIKMEDATIPLIQHTMLSYKWSGTYWPAIHGWQTGFSSNGTIHYWYAYNINDWSVYKNNNKLVANKAFAAAQKNIESSKEIQTQKIEIPKIYFFLLLLAASGYLWWENKIT